MDLSPGNPQHSIRRLRKTFGRCDKSRLRVWIHYPHVADAHCEIVRYALLQIVKSILPREHFNHQQRRIGRNLFIGGLSAEDSDIRHPYTGIAHSKPQAWQQY